VSIGTRTLGSGDAALVVSAEGLGCMGMSNAYGLGDEAESLATIAAALDAGVTLLDTADIYGPFTNEHLVGRAIAGRRDEVILATKFGFVRHPGSSSVDINGRPDYVRSACAASLTRLGVDHIDLYFQHRVDATVPIEDTWGAIRELIDEGKVRFAGISEASPESIRRANTVVPLTAVQSEWSIWTRDVERTGVLAAIRDLGIGFVAYSPLGRGFLTGAISSTDDLGDGDGRRGHPRFQADAIAANRGIVERVRELAQLRGCTASQLAIAWVLAQGDDVVPIPGTKRRRYLEENVAAAAVELSVEDLQAIDAVASAVGDRYPATFMKDVNR
jgi:aryl-alcohol dehydrogenase-like predicted oxidoreductase